MYGRSAVQSLNVQRGLAHQPLCLQSTNRKAAIAKLFFVPSGSTNASALSAIRVPIRVSHAQSRVELQEALPNLWLANRCSTGLTFRKPLAFARIPWIGTS